MNTIAKSRKEECFKILRELLPPGSVVWCSVTHVARSGMSRRIAFYIIRNNEPRRISSYIADLLGYGYDDKEGSVRVPGCGMDTGFHVVHNLSYALHGMEDRDGGAVVSLGLPENKNIEPTPSRYRAGYSLNHRWL